MPCRDVARRGNVLDRNGGESLPFCFREDRRWQRPGRALGFTRLVSCSRNDEKFSTRREQQCKGGKGLRQKRLQRIAFMDEIEALPPGFWYGEEIALRISDLRAGKPALRPSDRRVHEIERRDLRPGLGKTFGIVTKAATHIEHPRSKNLLCMGGGKSLRQRMRREIGPRHASWIALRQGVDGFKPVPPRGIGGQGAALHRGVERIEQLVRRGPAGGEIRRSAIENSFSKLAFSACLSCVRFSEDGWR